MTIFLLSCCGVGEASGELIECKLIHLNVFEDRTHLSKKVAMV